MIVALLMAAAPASPQTDMIARFKAGQLLCSNPDAATKTCSSIDRLTFDPDGTTHNVGEVLIAPDKPVTLEVRSVSIVDGPAICGTIDLADLRRGIVRANGVAVAADRNAVVLAKLEQVFAPLAGQRVCEALRIKDGALIKIGQADRVDLPLPGKPVRWISPNDGFRVAPRLAHSPQS